MKKLWLLSLLFLGQNSFAVEDPSTNSADCECPPCDETRTSTDTNSGKTERQDEGQVNESDDSVPENATGVN